MTSPEQEDRARLLLSGSILGFVALAALVGLVALGLRPADPEGDVAVARVARASTPADNATRTAARRATAMAAHIPRGRLFARDSVWNRTLPATGTLDVNSWTLVHALVAEVARERAAGIGPWISLSGTTTLYRVPNGQPRVRVGLDDPSTRGGRALGRAFRAVPIPPKAKPASGPDAHMTIWQPGTDRLWELYRARHDTRWRARWGGAIRRVSKSPGYYDRSAWRGATSNWGATATSLPVVAGTILLDDLEKGRIRHALALNVPAARAGVFAWPAQRTDGNGAATTLPEGAQLRLDPTLDVKSLKLPKFTEMIALAAQRHGLVVRDQTGHALSLFVENPAPHHRNAYRRLSKGQTPQQLLERFPWDRLQVLQMNLCTEAPCRAG
jgi:hypothetical protein